MKIRINFVSNSSSSNCIVVAKKLSIKDIKDVIAGYGIIQNQLFAYAQSGNLSDGQDFFEVNNNLLKTIAEYDLFEKFIYYDVFQCWDADAERKMERKDFPDDEFIVFAIDIDYHITTQPERLLERYMVIDE